MMMLVFSLCVILTAHSEFSYESYDVNTIKHINDGLMIDIEYSNVLSEDGKGITLKGVVNIDPKYSPTYIEISYFVIDGDDKVVYDCVLQIEANPNQNIYPFSEEYPFDLSLYEFEFFAIHLDVEKRAQPNTV